jgi:Fuc2NAc and GlcNAc transferase
MPAGFWVPAALISILSLIGDNLHLSPRLRLFFQFSFSILLLLRMSISGYGQLSEYLLIIALAIFIVGTANFYNFMDGINGIAGITGLVCFGLLAYYSLSLGTKPSLLAFNICIALACLGFLPFNIPRARVFMGDVGSILLGFLFAAVSIRMSDNFLDFICLSSFLFPFYIDELTTMLVRIKDGERLSRPHRRHLYQILANENEISHWKVSIGYGMFQLIIGSSILAVKDKGALSVAALLFLYSCIFIGFSLLFRRRLALKTVRN